MPRDFPLDDSLVGRMLGTQSQEITGDGSAEALPPIEEVTLQQQALGKLRALLSDPVRVWRTDTLEAVELALRALEQAEERRP